MENEPYNKEIWVLNKLLKNLNLMGLRPTLGLRKKRIPQRDGNYCKVESRILLNFYPLFFH